MPTSSSATDTLITAGVDVGTSSVKTVIVAFPHPESISRSLGSSEVEILSYRHDRIRRRDLREVVDQSWTMALDEAGLGPAEVAYVASTGEGELVEFRRGHFYGMTTHARGATFLFPGAKAVLDLGSLHARAMRVDSQSRVLANRMTSQCASGSGQFLENVARYLGVTLDEVGELSQRASTPESVSSVCAVLAETDVINMVSSGIKTEDILKGIHLSMAGRYVKLLRAIGGEGKIVITGGLSADAGLVEAMREKAAEDDLPMSFHTHELSMHAGALGAALWSGYRHRVLLQRERAANAPGGERLD